MGSKNEMNLVEHLMLNNYFLRGEDQNLIAE